MRCKLIAELATNFGGDIQLAKDMISAAADAGADIVKTQAYDVRHLRQSDPQYEWFRQSQLSFEQHALLWDHASRSGVEYLTTAYHREDLDLVKRLGLTSVKIGSGEGRSELVVEASRQFERVYATLPWGKVGPYGPITEFAGKAYNVTWFSTVPLYPAPPETYASCQPQAGWSDHMVGTDTARYAIARGAQYVEKHFHLPGRGPEHRRQSWNMTPDELRILRDWSETCVVLERGTKYEGRWTA